MANEQATVALVDLAAGGITYRRWQNHWLDKIVTWESQQWEYQQLEWAGLTAGAAATAEQATISLPALPSIEAILAAARVQRWLVTLRVYRFPDAAPGLTGPPATMDLIGSALGEIVGMSATQTQITLRLGSALSPVGAQFPWLLASNDLIGVPCRL